jgi:hypothetical protein
MQKVLLTVILALFVVFAAVGVKRSLTNFGSSKGTVVMASGPDQMPDIPPSY